MIENYRFPGDVHTKFIDFLKIVEPRIIDVLVMVQPWFIDLFDVEPSDINVLEMVQPRFLDLFEIVEPGIIDSWDGTTKRCRSVSESYNQVI